MKDRNVQWASACSIALIFATCACIGGPDPRTLAMAISPGSGAAMCGALTASDFKAAGVTAGAPKANVSDAGKSAYCVYRGKSSATGGVELDVFYPAGANATEVKATQATALGEGSGNYQNIVILGADEARMATHAVSGGAPFATILVRKNSLVFVLGIPAGSKASSQLRALSAIALGRLKP
jgi:hypothetical protein